MALEPMPEYAQCECYGWAGVFHPDLDGVHHSRCRWHDQSLHAWAQEHRSETAALRERVAELEARDEEHDDAVANALEECPTEEHCACAPVLAREVRALREQLQRAEEERNEARNANGRIFKLAMKDRARAEAAEALLREARPDVAHQADTERALGVLGGTRSGEFLPRIDAHLAAAPETEEAPDER